MGASSDFLKLNSGYNCPKIGLETALIKKEEDKNIVYQSIKDGIRLIDTEPDNEEMVGKEIKMAIDQGIVQREKLFIVTKLELEEKEDPEKALRKSLERLQLKYVDLYLDHWPSCICINDPKKYKLIPVKDTWEKLERLVDLGLTKSIGVCNYNIENMFNILSVCKIKPAVIEAEFNPYLYQKDLKEFCDLEKIRLFAYNPLVRGKYENEDFIIENKLDIFKNNSLIFLKEEFYPKFTIGQIILKWHMQLGVIPICGTSKLERMKENLAVEDLTIDKKHMNLIGANEEKQHRFNDGSKIFGINIFS